jgi:hypothetical protein
MDPMGPNQPGTVFAYTEAASRAFDSLESVADHRNFGPLMDPMGPNQPGTVFAYTEAGLSTHTRHQTQRFVFDSYTPPNAAIRTCLMVASCCRERCWPGQSAARERAAVCTIDPIAVGGER